ncbi:putative ornithine cyclodeaminase mu-crystallin [Anopheles sinensis]|uniref:Putative ornithine cyclodeaminase mu-crystallin n=1 Tax=Anopheles sinensis TaxID=74873 RepID=A0A084VWQ3_ANOSI|nr:putative ornithine cyclodeaminase mu-crystallin [Anopheles sinensis]
MGLSYRKHRSEDVFRCRSRQCVQIGELEFPDPRRIHNRTLCAVGVDGLFSTVAVVFCALRDVTMGDYCIFTASAIPISVRLSVTPEGWRAEGAGQCGYARVRPWLWFPAHYARLMMVSDNIRWCWCGQVWFL